MVPPRDSDFKELVRSRTDIVSLIGETVALQTQRGGREFVGLCPFHDDHRPSMRVNPEKQSFRCWACSTGGDCYTFVMLRDRSTFPETLELLATRAGLEMPKHLGFETPKNGITKQRLQEVLNWAEGQFHDCLIHHPEANAAREYLRSRGFKPETVSRFRLGYHPQDWSWLINRSQGKFSIEQLQEARLIGERQGGNGYYDYFVDRVLFPIRDVQGQCVAFGGRILPTSTRPDAAKYWNSPESSLFAKSRLLYGMEMARDGFKKTDTAVVVEGYTDCILAHQAGLNHFVGTLGTALTDSHVSLLKRFVRKVVLIYDGDEAGQNATDRSLPRFLAQELDLRILTLPDNLDPADAIQQKGTEWFVEQVQQAVEVWEFKFRRSVQKYGLESVDASFRVLEEMLQSISLVPTFVSGMLSGSWKMREDLLLGRLSQRLGIAEKTIRERLMEMREAKAAAEKSRVVPTRVDAPQERVCSPNMERLFRKPTKREQLELDLVATLLAHPEKVGACQERIGPGALTHADLARMLQVIYELYDQDVEPSFERVMGVLEDRDMQALAAFLIEQAEMRQITGELAEHVLQIFQHESQQFEMTPSTVGEILNGGGNNGGLNSKQALLAAASAAALARDQAQEQSKLHWKEVTKSG